MILRPAVGMLTILSTSIIEANALMGKPSLAFQTLPPSAVTKTASRRILNPTLQMSSIPEDEDLLTLPEILLQKSTSFLTKLQKLSTKSLPPLPEDHMALSGDVVALFVYSYLDHTVNQLYAEATSINLPESIVAIATNPESPIAMPVWYDLARVREFPHWLVDTSPATPPYAPALAHSGLAFVSITTCWIVCGYFSGAFLHKNTLECSTSNAVQVTGKTWACMAILMVGLALGSDAMWGVLDGVNPLSEPARGGLTKADADYIFDSLTVLAFWRFFFNWLLGYRR